MVWMPGVASGVRKARFASLSPAFCHVLWKLLGRAPERGAPPPVLFEGTWALRWLLLVKGPRTMTP